MLAAAEMKLSEIREQAIRGASKMIRDARPKDDYYSQPENDILADLNWVIKRPTPCDHLDQNFYNYCFYYYEYSFYYFYEYYRAAIYKL